MDPSAIPLILKELDLNKHCVANIYHHGSWVYGTNSPTSDRDLIIITRSSQKPVRFTDDFQYFHEFELYKLWNQYDVCVYSVENFEILLERNYLAVVQCVFLPNEFKIKEEIDFRKIYQEKYYNKLKLKQAAIYEMSRYRELYVSGDFSGHPVCSSRSLHTQQSRRDYVFKSLFHGLRYFDFVEQLLQTKSIHNYRGVTYLFDEMKKIRGDSTDNPNMEQVANFVWFESEKIKSKLDALIPTNIVKGSFEAHITFDITDNVDGNFEKIKTVCKNTKYKVIFIELIDDKEMDTLPQLIVSANYSGEYPFIVKQIKEETFKHFQDFKIIRIEIKSLVSNEGVPKSDREKELFWDKLENYFEFHYEVSLEDEDGKRHKIRHLRNICQSFSGNKLRLSHAAFAQTQKENLQYMITMSVSKVGKQTALRKSEDVVRYLTRKNFRPLQVVCEYNVYDSCTELDVV